MYRIPLVATLFAAVASAAFAQDAAPPAADGRLPAWVNLESVPLPEETAAAMASRTAIIAFPVWETAPQAPIFPEPARAAGIKHARVTLICRVLLSAALDDCNVVVETSPGLGFGEAAVAAAAHARLSPPSLRNAAINAQVLYTTHFDLPAN